MWASGTLFKRPEYLVTARSALLRMLTGIRYEFLYYLCFCRQVRDQKLISMSLRPFNSRHPAAGGTPSATSDLEPCPSSGHQARPLHGGALGLVRGSDNRSDNRGGAGRILPDVYRQ
jgi:hypothetical protein